MIIKPFFRPIHIWVMILVLALHALAVWAGISTEPIELPKVAVKKAQAIQVQLITLPTQNPSRSKNTPLTINSNDQQKIAIESSEIEPLKTVKKSVSQSIKLETDNKSLDIDKSLSADLTKAKNKANQKNKSQFNTGFDTNNSDTDERLNNDNANDDRYDNANDNNETEVDLAEMVRRVTAEYNRDRDRQLRNLNAQNNRELTKKAKLKQQADFDAINNLLALAAAQAKEQKENAVRQEQAQLNREDSEEEKLNIFLEDDGVWLEGHEPVTDMPLVVWQKTKSQSGDLVIVLLELQVDEEGRVTNVEILESSGDDLIDTIATTQVRSGQLQPLQLDGVAVKGVIPKSVVYIKP